MLLLKCCTQYSSKFGKLNNGHRAGKDQLSFQSPRKGIPKECSTTTQLHSSHTLAMGFPCGSAGKESACSAGDLSSIPELERSLGERKGYPLQYSWVSLVAQMVKNPLVMWETWVPSLGWKDPLKKGMTTHSSILALRSPMARGVWQATVHGVAKNWTQLRD